MDDLTIFVNTHSSRADCWPMFFGQLAKHWPSCPKIVVACDGDSYSDMYGPSLESSLAGDFTGPVIAVDYSPAKGFTNQYLMGLCAVETPYVLTMQEDFILYGDVDEAAIAKSMQKLNPGVQAARLIDSGRELEYSMQATIWNTRGLRCLYANVASDDPWGAELTCDLAMKSMRMFCAKRYDDHLPMRGRNHRDSPVFPYVSTALVRGKWNVEYRAELSPLLKQYDIDPNQRGWSA